MPTPKQVAPEPAAPATTGSEVGGVAGGVEGGVQGGTVGGDVGGKLGGIVGGNGDGPISADKVASPPSVLSQVRPNYPPLARARGIEGLVVVELIIDRAGRVEADSVRVKQSIAALDDAAIDAVRRWRFRPGRDRDGQTVRVILEVPIRFQLR
jgi:protein TonB